MAIKSIFNEKFAVGLLLVLGLLLAISPAGTRVSTMMTPEEVASSIASRSDQVTAEDLSSWIINKNPDLVIVDIRSSEAFNRYHIPGAINIPLAKLFDEKSKEILDSDNVVVLYSNGDMHASEAWVLLKQLNIDCYVLLGGLNYWAEAILNPKHPTDLAADSEILRYQFRKSVSGYFNNGGIAVQKNEASAPTNLPKPKMIKFKKKKKVEEGC